MAVRYKDDLHLRLHLSRKRETIMGICTGSTSETTQNSVADTGGEPTWASPLTAALPDSIARALVLGEGKIYT